MLRGWLGKNARRRLGMLTRLLKYAAPPCLILLITFSTGVLLRSGRHVESRDHRTARLEQWEQLRHAPGVSYRPHICVVYLGRLGNQMFQYASSFGAGRLKNVSLVVSEKDKLSSVFKLTTAKQVTNRNHCDYNKKIRESIHCAFDETLLNATITRSVTLVDYLQSWKYFRDYAEELRKEFQFNDEIQNSANAVFRNVTKHSSARVTYVGLHIRRGDKISLRHTGYKIAPTQYIINAMYYFLSREDEVLFVVCSDEIRWVKLAFKNHFLYKRMFPVERNRAEVDLAVLALCNHTIMTVGTFGWWAGWLAGGTTVYYNMPVKENSHLRNQFSVDYSDFFYPGWIGMNETSGVWTVNADRSHKPNRQ